MIHGQFRRWIVLYKSTLSVPFDGLLTQWQPVMNDVHVHVHIQCICETIDSTDLETINYYENYNSNVSLRSQINVIYQGSPAIDLGGLRRQFYTTLLKFFAENNYYLMDQNSIYDQFLTQVQQSQVFTLF